MIQKRQDLPVEFFGDKHIREVTTSCLNLESGSLDTISSFLGHLSEREMTFFYF